MSYSERSAKNLSLPSRYKNIFPAQTSLTSPVSYPDSQSAEGLNQFYPLSAGICRTSAYYSPTSDPSRARL